MNLVDTIEAKLFEIRIFNVIQSNIFNELICLYTKQQTIFEVAKNDNNSWQSLFFILR